MADRPTSDTPILDEGVYRPGYKDTLTGRQNPILGGLRDTGLDVVAGAIDVLGSPFAAVRDAGVHSGDRSAELYGQLGQRGAIDLRNWVKSGKTEYGQQEDRTGNENRSWLGTAVDTVLASAPAVGAAALTGPYAPATFGALAHAQQSTDFEEKLYNMPREEIENSPLYQEFKAQGMSHGDAVRAMHAKMRADPKAWAPNVAANVIFGGVAGRVMNKIGSRTIAQTMTQSIMKNLGTDVTEGAVGGALTGLGQSYGRQSGEITGGLRDQLDWEDIGKETWQMGTTLGGISTVGALARSRRPAGSRPGRTQAGTTERLLDDAGGREPTTPEIGTEQRLVATSNLNDSPTTPAEKVGTTPKVETPPVAPPEAPPAAGGVAPPVVPPEKVRPLVTPAVTPEALPPIADWQVHNQKAAVELAEKLGLTDRIGELAKTKTAEEISTELGGRLDASQVRAVREALGIQPLGPTGFVGVTIPESGPTRTPAEHPVSNDIVKQGGRDGLVLSDKEAAILTAEKLFDKLPDGSEALGQRALERLQEIRAGEAPPEVKPEAKAPTIADEIAQKVATRKAFLEAEAAGKAAKAGAKAGVAAEGAKTGFSAEALRERAADISQTPDAGTMQKHYAEWQAANPGKKLSNKNEIFGINKAAREAERKRIDQETRAKQAADKEAKTKAETEAKAEKLHQGLAALQSKGFAKLAKDRAAEARRQAEALKKKDKEKVTPEGKKPETPIAPVLKTPEEKALATPPDEKPNVNTLRAKLGLKPLGEGVTHGEAAKAELARKQAEAEAAGREAWKPVMAGEKAARKTASDTEGTAVRRDPKYSLRETTAKNMVEENKAGPNKQADLAAKEEIIKDGRPDDTPVKEAVQELVKEAKDIYDGYQKTLEDLRGGKDKKDLILTIGGGKTGESRATKKGDYHGFISDLNRYVRGVEKALKAGDHTKAKELTLKHLEDTKAVREGRMEELVEERADKNSAAAMAKKTYSNREDIIGALSKDELDKLSEADRQIYNDQMEATRKGEEADVAKKEGEGAVNITEAQAEANLAKNPVKPITLPKAKSRGIALPRRDRMGNIVRDRHGRMIMDDPLYPDKTFTKEGHFVPGVDDRMNEAHVDDLAYELKQAALDGGGGTLTPLEASRIFRIYGEEVQKGVAADLLMPHRPDDKFLRPIWDAVYDAAQNIPVEVWSRDMMEAYNQHIHGDNRPAPLAFFNLRDGVMVFRPATLTPSVIFHETIHSVTSRAMRGSERLTALVNKLQDIIESRYKGDIDVTADYAWQVAIKQAGGIDPNTGKFVEGQRPNTREFIAELFSRPEVADLVKSVNLRPAEVRALNKLGYRADLGKSILRTLWDGLLKAIGFKEKNPNAYKVAIDLLQDMFEREMYIRQSDEQFGRNQGAYLNEQDRINLWNADPKGGPGLIKAWQAGDFETVSRQLLDMNESGKLDEEASGTALKLLDRVNDRYWGDNEPSMPVPIRGPEAIRSDVDGYLDSRFGSSLKNAKFQLDNKFRTPLRKFFSGMQYTNDIGNTLGDAFKAILHPIKEAWARREHHAQEYMDKNGANKLIDDIATMKHAIKDRRLWDDFQRLLIRESYARAYSDMPLGSGYNEHIKAGELKNRQTERDYKANKILLDSIRARNPELVNLRNRIYEFSRKELDTRLHHQAMDMLLRENIVKHGDEAGLEALAKNIRRQDKSMTAAERKAQDRILGTDTEAKTYKDFEKKREDIRKIIDQFEKQGPHVPFMRHGKHAVFAEYDVKPKAGVKYNEVNPDKTGELNKMYDFAREADGTSKGAQDFIDNTLGHPEVEISLRDAHEVVYDRNTGEIAREWRVEHRDGNATTYASEHDARAAMKEGDKLRSRDVTQESIKQMADAGQPTGHLEIRDRVVFNPTEFVRFDSEREAHEFREQLNQRFDTSHALGAGPGMRTTGPNMTVKVTNVESPKTQISRANVAYTSAELQQWINRIEASEAYQSMTKDQQANWKREMRIEAARVTMTAGRRTMHLPREYARGASTDILRNMIDFAGGNARAVAELKYRDQIDKAVANADAYNEVYRNQSGDFGKDARARGEALDEIKQRLYAPIRVEDSWATGVKRALQVSMIGHLADTGYLIINAMEPWVFSAAISASRHGWGRTYSEMAQASKLINPKELAKAAGQEIAAAIKGEYRASTYEKLLIDAVTGPGNRRGDGAELAQMLKSMFARGLVARDVGTEVERTHNPSSNVVGRGLDRVDAGFRGFNTGIETFNRGMMAVANYRLEKERVLKDQSAHSIDAAHDMALKYAEDTVFKGAGDYSSWNNPRYLSNPFLKLAGQFKKYPLRIYSVYAEALPKAFRGDHEAQKQVAYMLIAQAVAAGSMGLPIASFGAGIVNAAYILGITDDNFDDVVFKMRQGLVDQIGVEGADLALHGALRFTGADFSQKMSQGSIFFQGSPESRKPGDLLKSLALAGLGAPGDSGAKFLGGIQKLGEAAGHYSAGASDQAMASGMEGAAGIIQVKAIVNIAKAIAMASGGYAGLPKDVTSTTGQALVQAIGLQPTAVANKLEARRTLNREKKKDNEWHNRWVNRWVEAGAGSSQQAAVWSQIQKANQSIDDPGLRIQYQDLWKAQQRKKNQARQDDSKLNVRLTGRQKSFADHTRYFDVQ